MNKKEYMRRLNEALAVLPTHEREEIANDYSEHFIIGAENGQTEDAISLNLGSPESLAEQYLADEAKKNPNEVDNSKSKLVMKICLLLVNLVFVIGPFLGIGGVLIGFFVVSVVLVIGGGLSIIVAALSPFISIAITLPFSNITAILFGVGAIIGGVLLFVTSFFLSKLFFKGVQTYINYMKKLIDN